MLIRSADSGLWANTRLGMEQAAGDLGAELRFLTPGADNDREEQKELLCREVERGTDALVLAPVDPADLGAEWAALAGDTPTVTLESELPGAVALITPDNEALGRALAGGPWRSTGAGPFCFWTASRRIPGCGPGWRRRRPP